MSASSPTDTRIACPVCGYNQTGNTAPRCPECGTWKDEFWYIADERAVRRAMIDATVSSVAPIVLAFPIALGAAHAGSDLFMLALLACPTATIANNLRSMYRLAGAAQALTGWPRLGFAVACAAFITLLQIFMTVLFVAPALDHLGFFD